METAQSRQENYGDNRTRIGVWKGRLYSCEALSFRGHFAIWKERKLNPQYIGPFEILGRASCCLFGCIAAQLSLVHNIFHISILYKYEPDPSHILILSQLN